MLRSSTSCSEEAIFRSLFGAAPEALGIDEPIPGPPNAAFMECDWGRFDIFDDQKPSSLNKTPPISRRRRKFLSFAAERASISRPRWSVYTHTHIYIYAYKSLILFPIPDLNFRSQENELIGDLTAKAIRNPI